MSKHIYCNLYPQTFPADDLDLELQKKDMKNCMA